MKSILVNRPRADPRPPYVLLYCRVCGLRAATIAKCEFSVDRPHFTADSDESDG